jgi:ABC-type transporter lipoprotein component MlaA
MTADTAATLAVLTLPVLAAVLTVRAVARHNYLRRALTVEKNRREWARDEYRTARSRYRQARRRAIADKYRTDRAAKRERRDIRRMHRAYHMHRRKYRIR